MIIETVPNISEGKNVKLINRIVNKIKLIPDIEIKDIHCDYDHNRSVFTILGKPKSVFMAIFTITDNVIEILDINKHQGVHPRSGIIDVIPFVPVKNVSYEKLIIWTEKFAYQFFNKYKIPVYLYSLSSKRPQTKTLSKIRNKGIEFIKNLSPNDKDYLPDIFEKEIFHPQMGVSFIGTRYPLIAFNFNIETPNHKTQEILSKTKELVKELRESNGGIKNLQALAFFLPSKKLVQLSTNILKAHQTDFIKIYNTIVKKIKEKGLELKESELVGCIPQPIIEKLIQNYFKLSHFNLKQTINFHIH
ncbi:MAG: glutamate formimidoyltransferase [bacterium]|nr:glutamate formimidoyltransferase [bacterium]